jgi:hypothetical protein
LTLEVCRWFVRVGDGDGGALAVAVAAKVVVVDDDVLVVYDVVHKLWTWDLGPWSLDFEF